MAGRYFEDFEIGQVLTHALPRTIHGGDISLYLALTGDRTVLASSSEFARSLGLQREIVPELLVFHTIFGQSVNDVSLRAVANLGYADVRFVCPVYPGDTLSAESEVIGLRATAAGDAGVVYVRTRGANQKGHTVLSFVRWVLVARRTSGLDLAVPACVPDLPKSVAATELPVPDAFNLQRYWDLAWATGSTRAWEAYQVGQRIDIDAAMTIAEAEHMMATRLYHNTAQVHFDGLTMATSRFGRRLIYGGHVVSVAHALAQSELGNMLWMAAWNGGSHVAPTFAEDTIRASLLVREAAPLPSRNDLGALRLLLVASKNLSVAQHAAMALPDADSKPADGIVLLLDFWVLLPRAQASR